MTIARIIKNRAIGRNFVSPQAWIDATLRKLQKDDVGAFIVSSDGQQIEGIISERDIVRGLAEYGQQALKFMVCDLMTEDVITCHKNDTALDVMRKLDTFNIRHVPVVDSLGNFEHLISVADIIADRLEDAETESSHMQNYIAGTNT